MVAAMGARVMKMTLSIHREETNFATVCNLIGQCRFAEMKLDMAELSEIKTYDFRLLVRMGIVLFNRINCREMLLEIVELKNVESLSVTIIEVSTPTLCEQFETMHCLGILHIV